MASMMTLRPSLVSTRSEAARAASVAPATAMPTSARLSAGASFTPSPVMPVTWPCCRMRSTIWNLCSGMTSAKPWLSRMMRSSAFWSLALASITSVERMFVPMPSRRHVSRAITLWSPVTILTSMPLSMAAAMVALVSSRGGS